LKKVTTLLEFLSDRSLRYFTSAEIYDRGVMYYHAGRVQIEHLNEQEVICTVFGSTPYDVELTLETDRLRSRCNCPHSAQGYFCKHMIAAALAARNHIGGSGSSLWKSHLSRALEVRPPSSQPPRQDNPFCLMISLQKKAFDWVLVPYALPVESVPQGMIHSGQPLASQHLKEALLKNPSLKTDIIALSEETNLQACVNLDSQQFAVIKILDTHLRLIENSYQSHQYPLSDYLSLFADMNIPIFLGSRHNPAYKPVEVLRDMADLRMGMHRSDNGVVLRAYLKAGQREIEIDQQAQQITDEFPYWIISGKQVLQLSAAIPENFLLFRGKRAEIHIPSEDVDDFLLDYLPGLAEHYSIEGDVAWDEINETPVPRLYLKDDGGTLLVQLCFGYGPYEVAHDASYPGSSIRKGASPWSLARVIRQSKVEEEIFLSISSAASGLKRGIKNAQDGIFALRSHVLPIDFLMAKIPFLLKKGFEIFGEEQLKTTQVNRATPTISINVSSGIDWFDLHAVVKFGEAETSLDEIRKALRKKQRYVKLADGTVGQIPSEWLKRYRHLFNLGEQVDGHLRFSNHHLTLVDQLLDEADQAHVDKEFRQRLNRLRNFSGIEKKALPGNFSGELRPYQEAGLSWLHFLHDYSFGGCLADDMGLGKTVQVLAFLQSLRENGSSPQPDLIVVPRSLLVNWQREAQRFTPNLRIQEHFGPGRATDSSQFDGCDLLITTYGTMRSDIKLLQSQYFNYAVLDESQSIKNPSAQVSKAARLIKSRYRLALTGTPVENTTLELWSQFAFLNPGLLGSLDYFKREFGRPIEGQQDQGAAELLRRTVFPFILRRTKEQVAPELPPRTERILYTNMEPAQRKMYERTRDTYRSLLLGMIDDKGMDNTRMKVLEGLLRLRQITNHPRLVNPDFRGDSAKFQLLLETMQNLQAGGHKALIFSQFVKMLKLVRSELDSQEIPYSYLDGSTRKRQDRVDEFQQDEDIPFFLISLKAGGLGLNLTAADYVVLIDPWWNPAVEKQASDRTHRIGQDKPVFIFKLIVRDSIEEKILLLQERKKDLVDQLITTDSRFFKNLSRDDVDILFS
jgi:non-specific serine/threonine protein kinase